MSLEQQSQVYEPTYVEHFRKLYKNVERPHQDFFLLTTCKVVNLIYLNNGQTKAISF